MMNRTLCFSVMLAALALGGCKSGQGGSGGDLLSGLADVAEGVGGNSGRWIAAGMRTGGAVARANETFDERQEYHIGRMAAAQILVKYPLYRDDNGNRYLNLVGKTLAEFSDRPQVFAGYNFHIVESNEVNAFAMPGAYILVTRGLLRCAENEDELAAILAHEIGHVQRQHAISAMTAGRSNDVWKTGLTEGLKAGTGSKAYGELAAMVTSGLTDMLKTVMDKGYSREQEAQADADAIAIMRRAGYDPHAMVAMLTKMKPLVKDHDHGFGSTHPSPDERIATVKKAIGGQVAVTPDAARAQRFTEALRAARAQ